MVLYARCKTLPNPKRGGLLNMIMKSNQSDSSMQHDPIAEGPRRTPLQTSNTLAVWIGIKSMPTRHKGPGLTPRPDEAFILDKYLLCADGSKDHPHSGAF
jgi:hypothetical protein